MAGQICELRSSLSSLHDPGLASDTGGITAKGNPFEVKCLQAFT